MVEYLAYANVGNSKSHNNLSDLVSWLLNINLCDVSE